MVLRSTIIDELIAMPETDTAPLRTSGFDHALSHTPSASQAAVSRALALTKAQSDVPACTDSERNSIMLVKTFIGMQCLKRKGAATFRLVCKG
jgi:hypothetical protein